MTKINDKSGHWKAIIMHLKRHHRKYIFGAIWWFALVKLALLIFWLSPVLNIGNIFADDEISDLPIILTSENIGSICRVSDPNSRNEYDIDCSGQNISAIDYSAFDEYKDIKTLNLSWTKLSTLSFTGGTHTAPNRPHTVEKIYISNTNISEIENCFFNTHRLVVKTEWDVNLSNNNISRIETGAFYGLNIKNLDLSYNKLSTFDFDALKWMDPNSNLTLNLSYNQIFHISNDNDVIISINELNLEQNCLPNTVINNLYGILHINSTNINFDNQGACFYVKYTPDTWTNGSVMATLTLTGNIYINENEYTSSIFIEENGSWEIPVDFVNPWNIINYPENGKISVYVDWIDRETPNCWRFSYHPVPNQHWWNNTVITATLPDSTDEWGSEILTGWWSCTIWGGEGSNCTVTISDNAWNTRDCVSDPFNIDTQAPTITLDKQGGAASNSHNVVVTITDDIAWFEENSYLQYKWQTGENGCDTNNYNNDALSNNEWDKSMTMTVSTINSNLSDWQYYLCISWVQDRAGNASGYVKSDWVFVIENNWHWSWPEPTVTWWLVWFGENTVSSFWRSWFDDVDIIWYLWSIGWRWYSYQNISGINYDPNLPNNITSGWIGIHIDTEDHNYKYICAFAQTGQYIQTICSDNKIKIDKTNPTITLTQVNDKELWDYVTLSWEGSDRQSWISEYELTITKPNNSRTTTGFNLNTTTTWITVDQTGTRTWSVKAIDWVGKTAEATDSFVVTSAAPGTPTPPTPSLEPLIQFESQPYNGRANNTEVKFQLVEWATWEWKFSSNNNTWSFSCNSDCQPIPSTRTLQFSGAIDWQYICAIAYKWSKSQTICSDNKVLVDSYMPDIDLLTPENWKHFEFGNNIIFKWSGHDNWPSWISWYILTIKDSDNIVYWTYTFNSWTTQTWIIVKKAGNLVWNVKIDDLAWNRAENSWYFYVHRNGDSETWFYLISPALFEQIKLWTDITFTWSTWMANSWYKWNIKKLWWSTISGWTSWSNHVVLDDEYFYEWSYSWSVTEIANNTTKSIPLFYVIEEWKDPDLKVNRFEFDEIDNAEPNSYRTSNKITIDWLDNNWYTFAYLKDGIWALYINWDFVWTEWVVKNWDKIHIELKANSWYNSTIATRLIVGTWTNLVSGDFKVTTKNGITWRDDSSLTSWQKLWWVIYVDSLVEMYQHDTKKLATFLSTFMQVLKDKSDYYAEKIAEAEEDWDDELLLEYKTYKNAIDFLYVIVKYRYDNIDVEDRTVYIAPNGKQYLVEFDEGRRAYTSPDFARPKYFPSWTLFTNHIDINNPAVWKWWIVWNVITTHNGKVYTIYETNWKWTSNDFKTKKYFDTKEDIINHILANNPASDWNHTIDTDFDEVEYKAPNGKIYKIFKTSSKWNNPEMYSSYNFVNAKYFTSLEAAKKFIDRSNPKK